MTVPEAARRAEISDSRWRQICQGYQMVNGNPVPIKPAPAETIARMARVVGVAGFQLREKGRPDAADALQEIENEERFAGKTTGQILVETEEISEALIELMRKKGLDLSSRQKEDLVAWSKLFATGMNEMQRRNDAS